VGRYHHVPDRLPDAEGIYGRPTVQQHEQFFHNLAAEREDPDPEVRSDALREFIDKKLTPHERHVIERVFFGRASMRQAGREIGLDEGKVRVVRDKALKKLRAKVLEDDSLREMFAAYVTDE